MKGICFKEPLFLKTIEGIKTQTRRIIEHSGNKIHYGKLLCDWSFSGVPIKEDDNTWTWELQTDVDDSGCFTIKPRYKVGETIYLKEPYNNNASQYRTLYKYSNDVNDAGKGFWKNKQFMPGSAARYFIKITDVRVERLQDISDEDCIKEGIINDGISWGWEYPCKYASPRDAYAALIDKINGKVTWESNPYVWVYDYKLIK